MRKTVKIILLLAIFLISSRNQAQGLPWLKVQGEKIVDEHGQVVILKGINLSNNVWGNWVPEISEKLQAQGVDPMIRPIEQDRWVLTDDDFLRLKKLGPKVVRYAVNYELFAADNPHREANLTKLKQHIKKFARIGIYVIISLHRPPGLEVQTDEFERAKPVRERLQSIFEDEEYWQNTIAMWQYLAWELKDLPAVAGYYLFNEPRLPSDADGGIKEFQRRYNELCTEIRAIDKKHILFVPEYNSRERNTDEDRGAQSVVFETAFVKVNDKNVVYAFSFYAPWEFTGLGAKDFDRIGVESDLKRRINWAKSIGKAPLLIAEYGVGRIQPMANRVRYLDFVHQLFNKYHLFAIYWEYKIYIGAYTKQNWMVGLYSEFVDKNNQVILKEDGAFEFQPWAQKAAQENGVDQLFRDYFWKNDESISLMDNEPIWQELHNFFLVEKKLKS